MHGQGCVHAEQLRVADERDVGEGIVVVTYAAEDGGQLGQPLGALARLDARLCEVVHDGDESDRDDGRDDRESRPPAARAARRT